MSLLVSMTMLSPLAWQWVDSNTDRSIKSKFVRLALTRPNSQIALPHKDVQRRSLPRGSVGPLPGPCGCPRQGNSLSRDHLAPILNFCIGKQRSPATSPTDVNISIDAIFKDSYLVDFLGLPEAHSEHELQTAIIVNLKRFLLELGRDFAFVGEQYLLPVGGQDFRLDLLFYHRELQALIAIELKVDEFEPEHLGKLEFYLEALDRDVRKSHENPSIGVLLYASKDNEVVEYALSRAATAAKGTTRRSRNPRRLRSRRSLTQVP